MSENCQRIARIMTPVPTLVFWISNPKSIFGKIWSEKDKAISFAWKLAHTHTHTHTHKQTHKHKHKESILRMLILILGLVFWNFKCISIFWANFSQESWIIYFARKLVHKVFWGCDCTDSEEGLQTNIKNNTVIVWSACCSYFLIASKNKHWSNQKDDVGWMGL